MSTKAALGKLPKEPSRDPYSEIASLLYDFVADLSKRVEGVPDKDGILQTIRPAHDAFRRAVRGTAPEFVPFEKRHARGKTFGRPKFLANEEEAAETVIQAHDDAGSNDGDSDQGERMYFTHGGHPISTTGTSADNVTELSQAIPNAIYIDEVLDRTKECVTNIIFSRYLPHLVVSDRARTRELQGNYPFVVQENFIRDIIKQWNTPAQVLCKTIYAIINEHVKQLVAHHFSAFGQGGLEQRIRSASYCSINRRSCPLII